MGFYSSVRSGVHLITNMGFMGNWMQASKAKLVLDAEIIESVLRIMHPLEITEEKTALDLIKKLGARSTYLTEKHTLKNYKKIFIIRKYSDGQPLKNGKRRENWRLRKVQKTKRKRF